jgi:hypothetical protein
MIYDSHIFYPDGSYHSRARVRHRLEALSSVAIAAHCNCLQYLYSFRVGAAGVASYSPRAHSSDCTIGERRKDVEWGREERMVMKGEDRQIEGMMFCDSFMSSLFSHSAIFSIPFLCFLPQ